MSPGRTDFVSSIGIAPRTIRPADELENHHIDYAIADTLVVGDGLDYALTQIASWWLQVIDHPTVCYSPLQRLTVSVGNDSEDHLMRLHRERVWSQACESHDQPRTDVPLPDGLR